MVNRMKHQRLQNKQRNFLLQVSNKNSQTPNIYIEQWVSQLKHVNIVMGLYSTPMQTYHKHTIPPHTRRRLQPRQFGLLSSSRITETHTCLPDGEEWHFRHRLTCLAYVVYRHDEIALLTYITGIGISYTLPRLYYRHDKIALLTHINVIGTCRQTLPIFSTIQFGCLLDILEVSIVTLSML